MVRCGKCNAYFTCSCNLISGFCPKCYGLNSMEVSKKDIIPLDDGPFNTILRNQGLTKEEKLRRINNILQGKTND